MKQISGQGSTLSLSIQLKETKEFKQADIQDIFIRCVT